MTEESVTDVVRSYIDILQCHDGNVRHNKKRLESLILTDELFTNCINKNCKANCEEPTALWFMSDISIEGFIKAKAYTLTLDTGADEKQAYYEAENMVHTVFDCDKSTLLESEIVTTDVREITDYEHHKTQFLGARNRKAFWSYLKNEPMNDPASDYRGACGYIERTSSYFNLDNPSPEDVKEANQLILENKHLASPLDLMKLCLMRKRVPVPNLPNPSE
jgi:hypothetical protein